MSKSVQRKLSKWLKAALNDYRQWNFTNICNGFQCKTLKWILILSGFVLRLASISKKHWKNACCLRKSWGLEWWDLSADLSHCTNNKGKLFKECQGTLCPLCACVCLAWAGNGGLLTPHDAFRETAIITVICKLTADVFVLHDYLPEIWLIQTACQCNLYSKNN